MILNRTLVADAEESSFTDHLDVACDTQFWCSGARDGIQFVTDPVGTISGGVFDDLREMVNAGIVEMVTFLATMWDKVPTPNITGESQAADTSRSAGALSITTVLDYTMYVGFALVMAAVIGIGAMMAVQIRQGEGINFTGRLTKALFGAVLIGGAGSIAAALGKQVTLTGSATIVFVQDELFWVAIAIVVVSIIIGGIRMAVDQQGRHGVELAKSLGTFIVVAGAGTTAVSLLILAGNEISTSILDASLECDDGEGMQCFGEGFARVLSFDPTGQQGWDDMGLFWTLLLGLVLGIVGLVQAALMFLRNIIISALLGFLIIAAAGTNLRVGKQMFDKYMGWMLAFVLYKPVAAVIYATALYPITDLGSGADTAEEMIDQFWGAISGIVLLVLALLALPALMRLLVPATSAMMGAAGGGMAGAIVAGGAMTVATGAKMVASGGSAKAAQASSTAASAGGGSMKSRSGSAPEPVSPAGAGKGAASGAAGQAAQSGGAGGGSQGGAASGGVQTLQRPESTTGQQSTGGGGSRPVPGPNGAQQNTSGSGDQGSAGGQPGTGSGDNSPLSGPSGAQQNSGPRGPSRRPSNSGGSLNEELFGSDDAEEDGPDGSKR